MDRLMSSGGIIDRLKKQWIDEINIFMKLNTPPLHLSLISDFTKNSVISEKNLIL